MQTGAQLESSRHIDTIKSGFKDSDITGQLTSEINENLQYAGYTAIT